MNLVWLFITAIPDLIKLLRAIQDAQDQAALNKKVIDDLKTLHQAFAAKDADAVTALFSGTPPPAPGVRAPTGGN